MADTMERRVIAFAEQLGRMAGGVQAKADGWMDREALNDQLTRIRDGAADLLGGLSRTSPRSRRPKPLGPTQGRRFTPKAASIPVEAKDRSGGKVGAPGKAHRKAPARVRSVKHSDEMIPKMNAALQRRHDRRS